MRFRNQFLSIVLLLFAAVGPVKAQVVTATIVGTAYDSSHSVVQGALVTVTNPSTGLTRKVESSVDGDFTFTALPAGTYQIEAAFQGFKKHVISGIALNAAQTVREDVYFEIGQVNQEITVQANAAAVESETSTVGQVISEQPIVSLPLNGRNFIQLAQLGSGTAPAYEARSATITNQSGRPNMSIHIAGGRGDSNSYLIDGVESRSIWFNSPSILLSPDAIKEFKIQKSDTEAKYGQGLGIVSLITKSGSNSLHGSAYEFIRNDKLNSADFFDNFFGRTKPPYRQNQFGFTVGGPVVKNKLFFFGGYEGLRIRQGSTLSAKIPNLKQLAGDLSGLSSTKVDPNTGQAAILNPFTGQPFANNQIPENLLSNIVQKFSKYIPSPNTNVAGANLVVSPSRVQNDDQFISRIDANLRQRDTASGRFIYYNSNLSVPGIAAYFGNVYPYKGRDFELQETHIFAPSLLNTLKLGFNRGIVYNQRQPTPNSVIPELGIANLTQVPAEYGLPNFAITSYSGLGGSTVNQGGTDNNYQFTDELDWTYGRHNISFGADIRRIQFQERLGLSDNASFSFDGRYSGNALADFLLGTAASATAQQGLGIANWRSTSYNFFVADNFKLTPRITLNLGLRYEYDQPFHEIDGKEGFFDPKTQKMVLRISQNYLPLQLPSSLVTYDPGYQPGIWAPDRNNWAPRVGFAYRATQNTVIRGGYGVFYSKTQGNELQGKINFPPLVITTTLTGSLTTPNVQIDQAAFPDPSKVSVGTLSPFSVDPSDRTPYVQEWNFGVERSFSNSLLVEASYVGSKGSKLAERINMNQAPLPADSSHPTPLATRRPFPGWGDILSFNYGEKSDYDGLQTRVQKTLSHGITLLAGYTWSHSIDTSSRGSGGSWHQNIYDRQADRGSSDFDVRHRFVVSYTYELPFGSGMRLLSNAGRGANWLVGGWSVNGITTFMSGNSQNVTVSGDRANTGGFAFQRANLTSTCSDNGNLPRSERTITRYFNTSCFAVTPTGTYGNSGRNIVQAPGLNNWDIALLKSTRLTESVTAQFRTELFDAWNHPQLGVPDTGVQNAFFGQVRSSASPLVPSSRYIQFGLKLLW